MTTPRVYTPYRNTDMYEVSPELETTKSHFILLSDHKEVVNAEIRKEHDRLEKIYCEETDRLESELAEAKAKLGEAVELLRDAHGITSCENDSIANRATKEIYDFLTKTATQGAKDAK